MPAIATLGPTLRRHRGVRSIEQVAAAAGITPSMLEAIETSRHLPPVPVIRAIVKAMQLELPARSEVQAALAETANAARANPYLRRRLESA